MTLKLYMTEISPSVRAVLLTARLLKITLELREVDLAKKEQYSVKFLKLNPQHTVPTLEDNGFVIWDSHAIIAYLVGKYGSDDSLYPRDLEKRALVDQRLHFESAVVNSFTRNILNPMLYNNCKVNIKGHEESIDKIYELLEVFLQDRNWIAGDNVTIADLSLIPSITSLHAVHNINSDKFERVRKWIQRAEMESWYCANENGLNKLKDLLDERKLAC